MSYSFKRHPLALNQADDPWRKGPISSNSVLSLEPSNTHNSCSQVYISSLSSERPFFLVTSTPAEATSQSSLPSVCFSYRKFKPYLQHLGLLHVDPEHRRPFTNVHWRKCLCVRQVSWQGCYALLKKLINKTSSLALEHTEANYFKKAWQGGAPEWLSR